MQADKLNLNENKTEVMLIGTRHQLSKVNLDSLTVGDTSVAIVNKARNLGVWFDSQLNFNVHITKTCSLSFCSLYKIRRNRKYLSDKSAQTLILALVTGHLDYCNVEDEFNKFNKGTGRIMLSPPLLKHPQLTVFYLTHLNRTFSRYDHIELLGFEEYSGMPRGHEHYPMYSHQYLRALFGPILSFKLDYLLSRLCIANYFPLHVPHATTSK